jgi:hypothetical protein
MTNAKEHIFLCDILGQYTPQTSCTIILSNHVFAARKTVILADRKSTDQVLTLLNINACTVIVKVSVNERVKSTPPPKKKVYLVFHDAVTDDFTSSDVPVTS